MPEKDTEISGENNAADENTDQSSEADSETEDVTEADKASEAETGAASETCLLYTSKTFARITGHAKLHDLCVDDLCTVNGEISDHTNIPHA